MDSRYISEQQPLVGARVVGPGFGCRAGRSVIRDNRVPAAGTVGPAPACANGPVFYKCRTDGGCARGTGPSAGGRMFHDAEKVSSGFPFIRLFFFISVSIGRSKWTARASFTAARRHVPTPRRADVWQLTFVYGVFIVSPLNYFVCCLCFFVVVFF